ncbi:MAG: HAMP domain-containing protein [Acidobacteria bacterium]|nr:HAMP domain-containing protein [Acidobacteriota bacterium]
MLTLSVLLYWNGVRSVESLLRSEVESEAVRIGRGIEAHLREREVAMMSLASSAALQDYVSGSDVANSLSASFVPAKVQGEVRAFLLGQPKRYVSLTCLNAARAPVFRAEPAEREAGKTEVRFQTDGFLPNALLADERVWTTAEPTPLRSPMKASLDATIRYSVPMLAAEEGVAPKLRGVMIVELRGEELFKEVAAIRPDEKQPPARASIQANDTRFVIILDQAGRILYHPIPLYSYRPVNDMMPASFRESSAAMIAGESGWKFYDEMDGARWLLAYSPVAPLGISVGVGGNYTSAVRRVQPWGWITILLSALFGVLTVVVLIRVVRHTARSIERVTEGAVAIAGGKLDQRIEVRSSDEIRLLAESFNTMTDKLREQIARETESRQFESFMRLSAMLTHDLKNAIASLSLLVGNMERQFHRAEFRADAMKSLTEATDKLRGLVAKLSEPVQSLSSEHQIPRPTDLVPVIKRVLDATVEPVRPLHEVEIKLPDTLTASVELDRIEKVFENLIINALEAMGQKRGKLTVSAGPTAHNEVFFSVSDTGPGMTEEFQRTKLFRAFATTKRRGVGLGLYTCREIVRAHRGHIDVESKRGSGTTFRVVLPSDQKIT